MEIEKKSCKGEIPPPREKKIFFGLLKQEYCPQCNLHLKARFFEETKESKPILKIPLVLKRLFAYYECNCGWRFVKLMKQKIELRKAPFPASFL